MKSMRRGLHPFDDNMEIWSLPVGQTSSLMCPSGMVFEKFPALSQLIFNCVEASEAKLFQAKSLENARYGLSHSPPSGFRTISIEDNYIEDSIWIPIDDTVLGMVPVGLPSLPLTYLL